MGCRKGEPGPWPIPQEQGVCWSARLASGVRLKIRLDYGEPPGWRRVEVDNHLAFGEFHRRLRFGCAGKGLRDRRTVHNTSARTDFHRRWHSLLLKP
jgi:hypothetical protein